MAMGKPERCRVRLLAASKRKLSVSGLPTAFNAVAPNKSLELRLSLPFGPAYKRRRGA
jgi:hypothetical protein